MPEETSCGCGRWSEASFFRSATLFWWHRHIQATGVMELFYEKLLYLGDTEEWRTEPSGGGSPGALFLEGFQGQESKKLNRAGTYIGEAGGGVTQLGQLG